MYVLLFANLLSGVELGFSQPQSADGLPEAVGHATAGATHTRLKFGEETRSRLGYRNPFVTLPNQKEFFLAEAPPAQSTTRSREDAAARFFTKLLYGY